MPEKHPRRSLISLGAGLAALGLVYIAGYATAHFNLLPREFRLWVYDRIESNESTEARIVGTIFNRLKVQSVVIPEGRSGAGGGFTSVSDDIVVLTHDGRFYLFSRDELFRLSIEAPANGFEEYVRAAESDYSHMINDFDRFRYNDVLYYTESGQNYLVASYTEWIDDRHCYGTAIARLSMPPNRAVRELVVSRDDWQIVFRTNPCLPLKEEHRALEGHMAGGRISYAGNQEIVLGSGDYHWDGMFAPEEHIQDPGYDLGKVIRINLSTGDARHLSTGHRNPQGVLVDEDGNVWTVEHGPRGGDELNLIIEGENYGWPLESYGTGYSKLPLPQAARPGHHSTFRRPVFAWVPSIATSGLAQVTNFDPAWDGDLLVSTLMGELRRLRIRDQRVVFDEPISISGEAIRYVGQHTPGKLVAWTDGQELLIITRLELEYTQQAIEEAIANSTVTSEKHRRLASILLGCQECHSFDGSVDSGPSLRGIYGSDVASGAYPAYSDALRAVSETWDTELLIEFLTDPEAVAPGTTMPNPNLNDEELIRGLVEALEGLVYEAQRPDP